MLDHLLKLGVTNAHFNSQEVYENGLFIPIKGKEKDGHTFIDNAIKNGAIAALWQKDIKIPDHIKNFNFIVVDDTLKAFQQLASEYREKVNPVVIAITGSNGKTTTKEMLNVVLSTKFKVHKNKGNFNNHLGVPLTLLSMPLDTEICILEMGMNHQGEISVLSNLAKPDIALITNIGESHIGLLGSRENIAKAKMEILDGLRNENFVFVDGDEPLLKKIAGKTINCKDLYNFKQNKNEISFTFEKHCYTLPSFGFHNAKNALFAIKVGKELGVSPSLISDGLKNFKNQDLRLEYVEHKSTSFLLDCYNSSYSSIKSGLDTFLSIKINKKKISILGDIFELGDQSISVHQSVGKMIEQINESEFYLVGKEMKAAYDICTFKNNIFYFKNNDELLDYLMRKRINDVFFYFKASRGMKLENIYKSLVHHHVDLN